MDDDHKVKKRGGESGGEGEGEGKKEEEGGGGEGEGEEIVKSEEQLELERAIDLTRAASGSVSESKSTTKGKDASASASASGAGARAGAGDGLSEEGREKINQAVEILHSIVFPDGVEAAAKEAEAAEKEVERLRAKGELVSMESKRLSYPREQSIMRLCDAYKRLQKSDEIVKLLRQVRPLFAQLTKAKTAKIVRTFIDKLGEIPGSEDLQISLCKEYIEWCRTERRTFLRQRIQTRLAGLLVSKGSFNEALSLLAVLQHEVKKLDDKLVLVEINVIESRAHHALKNLPKAKASLTAARSVASSIYVGLLLQSEIDFQGGMLNADEKDFRVAHSYFLEAFEGFNNLGDSRAKEALKYMLLAKIMNGLGDEVPQILSGKNALKYLGRDTDAFKAMAKAYKERSLKEFDAILQEYSDVLTSDSFISHHLDDLQGSLLEKNLLRVIEPFSRVEINHVAYLIGLPVEKVVSIISSMILDKKFSGILDQGEGILEVFDEAPEGSAYGTSVQLVNNLSEVTDSLLRRASKLA